MTTEEDTAYTFAAADFNFADADAGDALSSVKVVTVQTAGSLTHDGTAVVANQVVAAADLAAGKLKFTPAAHAHGDPYATFTFRVSDGTAESAAAYTMTVDVTAVNDAPTGKPAVSGTLTVGETLSAVVTGIADADGLSSPSWTYQWVRQDDATGANAADIGGATSSTYTLTSADLGKHIAVKAGFTDDGGTTEAAIKSAAAGAGGVERLDRAAGGVDCASEPVLVADQRGQRQVAGDVQREREERERGGFRGERADRGHALGERGDGDDGLRRDGVRRRPGEPERHGDAVLSRTPRTSPTRPTTT